MLECPARGSVLLSVSVPFLGMEPLWAGMGNGCRIEEDEGEDGLWL